jgi:hypothetical protein
MPEFQIMAINQLLGRFDDGVIVRAAKVDRSDEMAVSADDVNAIVFHNSTPLRREYEDSQSPMDAETRAVMGKVYERQI